MSFLKQYKFIIMALSNFGNMAIIDFSILRSKLLLSMLFPSMLLFLNFIIYILTFQRFLELKQNLLSAVMYFNLY